MPSEEELLLLFKESGVEFVETAAKAVGELGNAMDSVNAAQQAAVDVLKEEGTVVEDLKEKISKLKRELEALADAHKAGLITQDRYKEQSDALGKVISENETVLKRLTASQREHEAQARNVAQAADEEAAALAKITTALNQLEAEEEQELIAAQALAEKHYQMVTAAEAAAGTGQGEAGKGGMAGLAANVMKAEKVISGLAGGSGFGRMGGMLEGITTALGLAGGTGMAAGGLIFALEAIIPKIQAFIDKMDGAAESSKHAAEMTKAAIDQMQRLKEQPDEEEQTSAKVVKEALRGKKGMQVATGIEQSLEAEGYGLSEDQKKILATPGVSKYEKDIILEGQRGSIITRRERILKELESGHQATISDVSGMASQFPGFFPPGTEQHLRQALPENIEAAKKQAKKAEADSDWANTTYAKREAARKESEGIDLEFDKALKDKRKQDVKAKATGFKDQIGDLKTQLSDLGLDLREQKITPGEYHDKADILVDAIAAAVQAMSKIPGEELKTARRDIDAAQRQVRNTFDQGVKAVEHAADKARKDAKTKAEHDARQNTPEAVNRREMADVGNRIMAAEQAQNQYRAEQGGTPFEASELEQIKHKVMQNMPAARARGWNLAQLVDWAMAMQANEIEQGIFQGLGQQNRSGQNINPRGGH